jgi:MoaA/NifB/PqqE/SkfB family radical SAM enzyme
MAKYTTDGKVQHLTRTDEDVNDLLVTELGEKFKEYRKEWNEANNMEKVTEFPLFLQLDTTQKCNFKCPHCMLSDEQGVKTYFSKDTISNDDFKLILEEAEKYSCPSISLQGTNEPLLDKNLEVQIQKARDKGFIDIMINSNASALTEKRAKKILESGLTRIRFSIDAIDEATFKKVRVGGDFEQVKRNILRFMEIRKNLNLKLPVVGVSFCVLADNYKEKDDFVKYWADKVDFVSIQRFTAPTPDVKWDKFFPINHVEEEFKDFKCPQPFQRLVIRNKDITPCCTWFSRELTLGRVGEVTLHDAWHSEKMVELRKLHRNGEWYKNETCKKCVNSIFKNSRDTADSSRHTGELRISEENRTQSIKIYALK